jgi:hypothetical protein
MNELSTNEQTGSTNFFNSWLSPFSFFSGKENVLDLKNKNAQRSPDKVLALDSNLRFRDGSTPILYKQTNAFQLKLMKKREEKLNIKQGSQIIEDYLPVEPAYTGLTLIPLPNNKYAIRDGLTNQLMEPIPGQSYAFATMPDGSIRVTASATTIHIYLSNSIPAVRYVGNVTFNDKSEILGWDNCSGAYCPEAELAHQAGFHASDMNKFNPLVIRSSLNASRN